MKKKDDGKGVGSNKKQDGECVFAPTWGSDVPLFGGGDLRDNKFEILALLERTAGDGRRTPPTFPRTDESVRDSCYHSVDFFVIIILC